MMVPNRAVGESACLCGRMNKVIQKVSFYSELSSFTTFTLLQITHLTDCVYLFKRTFLFFFCNSL